jgi:cytochrome c biogenesis protein CcdA
MVAVLLALLGLAFLDSLNVLNVGVVSAVVYDGRLRRRSPVPAGLSFIAGLFAVTTSFGLLTVLGLSFLTGLVDIEITSAIRYRGELALGLVLLCLAFFRLPAQTSAPGWAMAAMRERPWLLGFVGGAIGFAQAPTAVPYLAGLAMIAALDPRPPIWPVFVLIYCAITLLPPSLVLFLSTRRTKRAQRIHRRLVRTLTRYGPAAVRAMFLIVGVVLISDALLHLSDLW